MYLASYFSDFGAHVLVPELALLAHSEVLGPAEEGVAGVLTHDVIDKLVGLTNKKY